MCVESIVKVGTVVEKYLIEPLVIFSMCLNSALTELIKCKFLSQLHWLGILLVQC